MIDSFFLDLTKRCKTLFLGCNLQTKFNNISAEALHKVFEVDVHLNNLINKKSDLKYFLRAWTMVLQTFTLSSFVAASARRSLMHFSICLELLIGMTELSPKETSRYCSCLNFSNILMLLTGVQGFMRFVWRVLREYLWRFLPYSIQRFRNKQSIFLFQFSIVQESRRSQ